MATAAPPETPAAARLSVLIKAQSATVQPEGDPERRELHGWGGAPHCLGHRRVEEGASAGAWNSSWDLRAPEAGIPGVPLGKLLPPASLHPFEVGIPFKFSWLQLGVVPPARPEMLSTREIKGCRAQTRSDLTSSPEPSRKATVWLAGAHSSGPERQEA